jgi:hypothetical protein
MMAELHLRVKREIGGFLPEIGGFLPEIGGFLPEIGGFLLETEPTCLIRKVILTKFILKA